MTNIYTLSVPENLRSMKMLSKIEKLWKLYKSPKPKNHEQLEELW